MQKKKKPEKINLPKDTLPQRRDEFTIVHGQIFDVLHDIQYSASWMKEKGNDGRTVCLFTEHHDRRTFACDSKTNEYLGDVLVVGKIQAAYIYGILEGTMTHIKQLEKIISLQSGANSTEPKEPSTGALI